MPDLSAIGASLKPGPYDRFLDDVEEALRASNATQSETDELMRIAMDMVKANGAAQLYRGFVGYVRNGHYRKSQGSEYSRDKRWDEGVNLPGRDKRIANAVMALRHRQEEGAEDMARNFCLTAEEWAEAQSKAGFGKRRHLEPVR